MVVQAGQEDGVPAHVMKKVLPVLHRRVNVGLYESVDPAPAHPATTNQMQPKVSSPGYGGRGDKEGNKEQIGRSAGVGM